MIDVHSHVLPCVDDGSASLEVSLNMLRECEEQGITDVILTPHYRLNFEKLADEITAEFIEFKKIVKENGIGVNLFIGQEVYFKTGVKNMLKEEKLLSLNNSKYVLIEFSFKNATDVPEAVYDLSTIKKTAIVAHPERYHYFTLQDAYEIKSLGGLIQVNATSIVNKVSRPVKKILKQLLKNDLVDIVASDLHDGRKNDMQKAYEYITKKYGVDRANKLFIENPKKIIEE